MPQPTVIPATAGSATAGNRGAGLVTALGPAVVAALAGAVLTVGAALSAVGLLVAVAFVQGLLVLTWALSCGPPRSSSVIGGVPTDGVHGNSERSDGVDDQPGAGSATAVPGRIGTLLIGAGAAAGADIAASVRPHDALAPLLVVLGLTVPAMFIHQLVRGVVRVRVVESLSGIAVLVVCVVALTALLQLRHEFDGARMTGAAAVVAVVSVVVAHLVDVAWSRPRFDPRVPRGFTGVLVGVVAGTAAGVQALRPLAQYGNTVAALLCAGTAAVAVLLSVSASMIDAGIAAGDAAGTAARNGSRSGAGVAAGNDAESAGRDRSRLRPVALALLPLTLVSPVAYLLLLVR